MFAAVILNSSLTAELGQKLELQQKKWLAVTLGPPDQSYSLSVTSLPDWNKIIDQFY